MYRPVRNQREFYDGHHKQHDLGYFVCCSAEGIVVMVFGGAHCRLNDLQVLRNCSDFTTNQQHYITGNDRILFDGIFASVGPPFITPFVRRGGRQLSALERRYNRILSRARIIIENVFARIKTLWPIVGRVYRLSKESLDITVRNAFILHNIVVKYQSGMGRRH